MQIRLTVLRPRTGPGAPATATDVLVTAPVGTALGALSVALAGAVGVRGPRSATHVHLYAGSERIDDRTPLGHPPLLDGALLSLGEPDPQAQAAPAGAAAELRVVGGPDAGGVHRLHGRQIRLGRSSEADVPLDDPDVSRMHLALQLAADGSVTVHDLGSTNGTLLDGRPLAEEPQPLPPGALLRLGESTVALAAAPEQARATTPDGLGHLQVGPPAPPAVRPAGQAEEQPPPAAPSTPSRTRSLLSRTLGRTAPTAAPADPALQLQRARERQAAALRERFPDPAALLLGALGPGPRLWERLPAHPDALVVRLGTADLPTRLGGAAAAPDEAPEALLPAVPVTVELAAGGLGLAGPRERLLGLARALLAQLTVLHPPSGLSLVVISADGRAAAEQRAEDWSWALWLPHLRPTRGQDCRLLFGLDPAQAEQRLTELLADPEPVGPTVLLVDGDPGSAAAREALARLLRGGHAVHPVCLAEAPDQLPPGLGATAVITGEVATQLSLRGPRPVEGAALDAVSPAWAERLARALAPLRETAPVSRGPIPEALRLLDLLELDTVTPAKLSARWAGLPSTTGTASALLGTTRDDLCTVELANAELPEQQHVLVGGARGAGKSELLRTLAASLAVGERPDRLSLLLIGGAGPSLAACAELPHVGAVLDAAADPRQALLTAEALLDELTHREELFRGRPFAAWYAEQALRSTVVAPRGATPATGPAAPPAAVATATAPPPRLVVVVDDYDELLAPQSPAGRPLARALAAVAQRGGRLGVHLVAATGRPELTVGTEVDNAAQWRIALRTDHPGDSDLLVHVDDAAALPDSTPGRGYLRRPDGAVLAFQTARITGRIPRTATLRPTVVALDPAQLGTPPTRRPVRELGNGPTDLALLASALQRAAASG
ncbi:FtsK/SpoIIIE domain-containing protein [Kitasatospora viridis]|uniref:S-DNA-T family DNA segregation ATPase FtsK/SpoIIIE n=1 Tax=Kitasatospora viridis TaxID=281105 RepID=A0A561UK49_9ACTN|nr:FtsK/SpoIIIE domain-containing protein [Kitasatospora viridis]TWF99739.1 S-DNA-T family DNA segregation ATPase FtsK/SpoIIIE [Kitasatospora viridis]